MATLQGQKLGIEKQVQVAGAAGYDAIEPWLSSLNDFVKAGGKLADLKRQIADQGLTVESAIAFSEWLAEDATRRAKGLEQAKREMDLVAQIGGKRIAAPPAGATDVVGLDPLVAAERYRALLEIGDQMGVVPELELWGFSKALGRLSECVAAAVQCGHPRACMLNDIFHLYKSGSDYRGLAVVNGRAAAVLHMNDYPADPPREKVDDSYRVYPGDGICPLPRHPAFAARNRRPANSIPGTFQPEILEARRVARGQNRPGQNEARGGTLRKLDSGFTARPARPRRTRSTNRPPNVAKSWIRAKTGTQTRTRTPRSICPPEPRAKPPPFAAPENNTARKAPWPSRTAPETARCGGINSKRADGLLVASARPQVNTSTTVVRMAVARFEFTPLTPTLASTAVRPANRADNSDQRNQFISVSCDMKLHSSTAWLE